MTVREGRWDCDHCGAVNRGRNESCAGLDGHSGCGAARPKNVEFYLPGDARPVTDAAQLADANSGQDWYCDHCGGANPNAREGRRIGSCKNCGEARTEADESHKVTHYAEGAVPRTAEAVAPERPRNRPRPEAAPSAPASRPSAGRVASASIAPEMPSLGNRRALADPRSLKTAALVLLGFLGAMVLAWGLWPVEHDGIVAEKTWERSITILVLDTDIEQGWSVPAGGRELRSERKIRSYRDVIDHYETRTRQVTDRVPSGTESYPCGTTNLGNGYFRDKTCTRTAYRNVTRSESYQHAVYRKEPVWDTWHTYEEDEWEYDRTLTKTGRNSAPVWPELPAFGPREREGTRTEVLIAAFDDAEGERTGARLEAADWNRLEVGDPVRWSTSALGGVKLLPAE